MATAFWKDLLKARQDAGLELLPVNTYDVKVNGAEAKTNTTSGRKSFIIDYEITSGPLAGRKTKNWMTIVEEYPGLVDLWLKEMAAMGLSAEFFMAEPSDAQVCDALKGRTCQIKVGRRKKNKSPDADEVEDIKVLPPASGALPVATPAADPMAAAAATPAADPNAPGLPPF